MRSFNTLYCFLFALCLLVCSCGEDEPDFTNSWDEDIYVFGKELEERHYDLFFQLPKEEFEKSILDLRSQSGDFTKGKAAFELSKIISKIGDSHTGLQLGNHLSILPSN